MMAIFFPSNLLLPYLCWTLMISCDPACCNSLICSFLAPRLWLKSGIPFRLNDTAYLRDMSQLICLFCTNSWNVLFLHFSLRLSDYKITNLQTNAYSHTSTCSHTALWSIVALWLRWLAVTEEGAWLTPSGSLQCSVHYLQCFPPP